MKFNFLHSCLRWTFMVCCLFALGAQAQNSPPSKVEIRPIVVDDAFTERTIGLDLDFFEDKSSKLTLVDVRSTEYAQQFVASTKASASFGFTSSAYWLRFGLQDQRSPQLQMQSGDVLLTVGFAQIDNLDLWCSDASGQQVLYQRAGDHVPPQEWPVNAVDPTFKLPSVATSCWLRVQSSSSLQLPLTLRTQDAFTSMRLTTGIFQAMYYGALLVMVAYNGLVAVATRSWAYGTYTLFLIGFGFFQATFGGVGYALLWPGAIGWADSALLLFLSMTGATSIGFAMIILEAKEFVPRLFKLGVAILVYFALCVAAIPFLPYSLLIRLIYLIVPLWAVFLIGSGGILAWRGVRVAQIFMAAWFVFIMAGLIVIGRGLGWLPINSFTVNALQIGSALEFVLLSFALSDRIKTWQKKLLTAEKQIVEDLRNSEQVLEQKVAQRTAELSQSNAALTDAKQAAEQALQDLQNTQAQLVQSEKMASLGVLVDNVAHELNSPIGAVKSSGQTIADSLSDALVNMPKLFVVLDDASRSLFTQLVSQPLSPQEPLSSREERVQVKLLAQQLQEAGVQQNLDAKARMLMKFQAQARVQEYLPLFTLPQSDFILHTANSIATIVHGTGNINTAVDRVTRIVYALKAFSAADNSGAMMLSPLQPSVEKALHLYQSRIHQGIELVCQFESIGMVRCLPDDLVQVWSHLILNALQAMKSNGTLTINIRAESGYAVVSVTDTGSGIADDAQHRIFEPFFTTRTSGEGSGLGLAIVKKVIDKHQGRIEVQSNLGVGTTLRVYLPLGQ